MESRRVIISGEESEGSSDESLTEFHDGACGSDVNSKQASRTNRVVNLKKDNSVLHQKLFEANANLQRTIDKQFALPYETATTSIDQLSQHMQQIQSSMSDTCQLLRHICANLRAVEDRTSAIVSGAYLEDVRVSGE